MYALPKINDVLANISVQTPVLPGKVSNAANKKRLLHVNRDGVG